MSKKKIVIRVIVTLLFLVSLYFVEAGFCGSGVVAEYNGGFGTVDMKSYNVETVQSALSPMSEEGISVYKLYYLMDFVFILFFGIFQLMVTNAVFSFKNSMPVKIIIFGVPVLRGICDIIENIILLTTLYTYPSINETAISVSAKFTMVKLMCVKVWVLIIIVGLIWKVVTRLRKEDR